MDLKDKKVLVTGADGFIGSHLVEMLVGQGGDVRALSFYNSFNNLGWLDDISCRSEVEVLSGDIRDSFFVERICRNVDVVFHLAALIAIPYSYVAPMSYIETNVKGTLNICEAALRNGCKRIIHTSTSEVYGSARHVPIDEDHPLQPQSPYSASKTGADQLALSYFYSFGLPVVVARPFNTYGPRQSLRAVIPSLIIQHLKNKEYIEVGDLTPTRDFNFVEDTCRGFIRLAETASVEGEVFNIGSNYEITVGEIAAMIGKITGCRIPVREAKERLRPGASEVRRLWCENRKITERCGFKPEVTIEAGLKRTVEWFRESRNLAKYKSDGYVI